MVNARVIAGVYVPPTFYRQSQCYSDSSYSLVKLPTYVIAAQLLKATVIHLYLSLIRTWKRVYAYQVVSAVCVSVLVRLHTHTDSPKFPVYSLS